jgi:hypothetical protein
MPRYFLVDELVDAQGFRAAVTPFVAHALVEAFGEGFGEAVGDGLGHDGVVVVVGGAEAVAQLLRPMPVVTANAPM